jgi:ribonucleoside-diphosphate reductase alpha chain
MAKHYVVDVDLAYDKFFNLLWKGWLSPSTPVMSNSGTGNGMVVSCSGGYIEDSVHGFYKTHSENAMLSKLGYGTSSYLGDIRPRGAQMGNGGQASGIVPVFDTAIDVMTKISQGSSRRGAWAGYLPVDHDDFWEMAGYTQKNPADTNIGWMYSDAEIERLKAGDKEAIQRFNKVLYGRCRMGKGYMWKNDLANRLAPQAFKSSGITIKASNLCNEVSLPQDEDHTFTCVLSSLNLAKWDEFEDDTIYWATVFLDCVASEMLADPNINRPELANAKRFTEKARALGLGVMGLATYFQQKMIPFEGLHAHILNNTIFKKLREESYRASRDLAKLFGEPEWCKGTGMRNATTQAVA